MRNIFDYLYTKIIYIDNDIEYENNTEIDNKILVEIQTLKSYYKLYEKWNYNTRDSLKYIFENILEDIYENGENSSFYFDYKTSKLIDNYYRYMCIF